MKKIVYIIVVLLFVLSELFLIYKNSKLKSEISSKDQFLNELTSKYQTIKPQYELSIQNVGKTIKDFIIQDSLNNEIKFSEYIGQIADTILICRFSEKYCQQCVNHAISVLKDNSEEFDFSKILFIADNSSTRVYNLQNQEYNLKNNNVVNIHDLSISAETLMFPYYIIINKNLEILAFYTPNKTTHGTDIDFKNLKFVYDNFFK
ncbi:MAG: hypothetical protein MJ211_06305 [Bacteroidales bacterium]|nr:hypothetical protein [Bacteroidales bacterium]